MRKLVGMFAFLSIALAASSSFAADATGAIQTMNPAACTIVLRKTVYKFDHSCDFSKLRVGEKVTITYSRAGTTLYATAVKPA